MNHPSLSQEKSQAKGSASGIDRPHGRRDLLKLGNLLAEKCALEEARETYQRVFEESRHAGDVRLTAEALGRLLRMASEARDLVEITRLERELKATMASFPSQIPSGVWYCQAVLAGHRERWNEAQSLLRQFLRAVNAEKKEGVEVQPEAEARGWVMLANVFAQRGCVARSRLLLHWALREFSKKGLNGIDGMIELQMAWIHLRARELGPALGWLEKAHASFLSEHNWYLHLYVLYAYACLARLSGDFAKADWYLDMLQNASSGPAFGHFRELVATERRRLQQESVDLRVDGRKLQVHTREKNNISLGKQYVLLHILEALSEAHHREGGDSHRALSKAELIEKVWGEKYRPHAHDNKLYYNINRLRKLIEPDMKEPQYLLNWKEGYRLAPGLKVQLQGANNPLKRAGERRADRFENRGDS
ncbi:MAG: helix-turn-helix domain-containing protein [Oligoflexia bacterium]